MINPKSDIKIANFITLKAKPGKESQLAEFLSGGAAAVAKTEPQTKSWFAVRIDNSTFAIIDFFADQAGQDAHVGGQVAAALKARADDLIEGGWDGGVLKHFQVFNVLSAAI
jgi:quinol monooxygenase YgiN